MPAQPDEVRHVLRGAQRLAKGVVLLKPAQEVGKAVFGFRRNAGYGGFEHALLQGFLGAVRGAGRFVVELYRVAFLEEGAEMLLRV